MKHRLKWILVLLTLAVSSASLAGAGFQPGNILIMNGNILYEYDLDGNLVSQLTIPPSPENEVARDVTVLDDGRLAVFNGTFYPELAIYDGTSWQSTSIPGWSISNNVTYGGITTYNGNIILTDGFTYSGGEAEGLIRVNPNDFSYQRYAETTSYIDVVLGHDGLLYALQNTYGDLDVYDPVDFSLLRSVDLGHTSSSRGISVNANGDIFMTSLNGYVAHYNASGELLNTLQIVSYLSDIDLDVNGNIILGASYSTAFTTDESLLNFTPIAGDGGNIFVAFVPTIAPPELSGSHYRNGRWIRTTLTWTTEATAVDVYRNDELIDTVSGMNSATYNYHKKYSQSYQVRNMGTENCSEIYLAN
ncbi:MAG: hypothetical protein ABW077_10990 [Candidatus Thiodiazotropha endolucinida]